MQFTTKLAPDLIAATATIIAQNAAEITKLDQVLGDGDHIINLQRGIAAVQAQCPQYQNLQWLQIWQKIGFTLLNTMGGASGSLFGTLFISMGKPTPADQPFAEIYANAVLAVQKRGKSAAGEKTMLDTLIPVAEVLANNQTDSLPTLLDKVRLAATDGVESTRNMLASKGRASYLQEKSIGHLDAGAKTCQLIICAIVAVLTDNC